jgi:AraC-like DNA-binding protein
MMVLRHCGVRNADVIHTHFTHPQPAYVARCRALFGGVVRFGQPGCEIAFDASWLDARQERRDASAYALAQARAQAELADIEGRRSIGLAVTRLLERSRAPLPGMAQAAALLGMSERTLRRQLAAAGLSYAELYEARRRSEIERLLIQGDMPLKEIAEAVGYASVGSFHRAFRRHSGLTPLQWLRGRHADAAVAP